MIYCNSFQYVNYAQTMLDFRLTSIKCCGGRPSICNFLFFSHIHNVLYWICSILQYFSCWLFFSLSFKWHCVLYLGFIWVRALIRNNICISNEYRIIQNSSDSSQIVQTTNLYIQTSISNLFTWCLYVWILSFVCHNEFACFLREG